MKYLEFVDLSTYQPRGSFPLLQCYLYIISHLEDIADVFFSNVLLDKSTVDLGIDPAFFVFYSSIGYNGPVQHQFVNQERATLIFFQQTTLHYNLKTARLLLCMTDLLDN